MTIMIATKIERRSRPVPQRTLRKRLGGYARKGETNSRFEALKLACASDALLLS